MTDIERNEWARRRAQVGLVEQWARVAGSLLDSGTAEQALPIADRQAYEAEFHALNQRMEQALLIVRESIAGIR